MDLDVKDRRAGIAATERELSQLVAMVPSHSGGWLRTRADFLSKRMVDFLGLDVADIDKPGTSRLEALIETIHPDDAAEFRDTLRRCLVTARARHAVSPAPRRRRLSLDVERAEPMRDQNGRIVQWYGLCHDIDDQVHAEERCGGASGSFRR